MEALNDYFVVDIKIIVQEATDGAFATDESSCLRFVDIASEIASACMPVVSFLDARQEKVGYSLFDIIGNARGNIRSINEALAKVSKVAPKTPGGKVNKHTTGAKSASASEERVKVTEIRAVIIVIEKLIQEFLETMDKSPLHLLFASLRCGHRGGIYLIEPLFNITQTVASGGGGVTYSKSIRPWSSFKYIFRPTFLGAIYKASKELKNSYDV